LGDETAFRDFAAKLAAGRPGSDRDDAGREMLARYAAALLALVRRRCDRRLAAKADPEDVLQSVLRTFFRRLDAGTVELRDWGSLWGFLALATLRKCRRNADRYGTASRDVGREVSLFVPGADAPWEFYVPARGPTPEEEAVFDEELERLLAGLKDRDRRIVRLMLEGESTSGAAASLDCSERTVHRAMVRVRDRVLGTGFGGGPAGG